MDTSDEMEKFDKMEIFGPETQCFEIVIMCLNKWNFLYFDEFSFIYNDTKKDSY